MKDVKSVQLLTGFRHISLHRVQINFPYILLNIHYIELKFPGKPQSLLSYLHKKVMDILYCLRYI